MAASFADTDIWHVMIADDMKRMNVEQLDDAFRLSLVDASTLVWKAGMKGWQSLGAVAGIEDEPEMRRAPAPPPPPPRPIARPVPKPPSPRAVSTLAFQTTAPAYAAPLVAPVHPLALTAPDPYVLPKRRVSVPSEVDFRRRSGGVRWGRWLVAVLLVTGGVLGAYRQNLLREGARRAGLENKYLYGERRVTSFVSAKAPPMLKQALTRLALLPGPNAEPSRPSPVVHVAPPPAPAPVAVVAAATTPVDSEVKTVSLDSLPTEPASVEKPVASAAVTPAKPAAAVVPAKPATAVVPAKPAAAAKQKPSIKTATKVQPKAEKPQKEAAKPAPAPAPVANESPLKAAIRSAIAADSKKK